MKEISVEILKQKLDAGEDIKLLDVREIFENEEFNIGGKLIPLGEIPARLDEIEDWQEEQVVVYCRSGRRSKTAQQFLLKKGFQHVSNLTGGVLDWKERILGSD